MRELKIDKYGLLFYTTLQFILIYFQLILYEMKYSYNNKHTYCCSFHSTIFNLGYKIFVLNFFLDKIHGISLLISVSILILYSIYLLSYKRKVYRLPHTMQCFFFSFWSSKFRRNLTINYDYLSECKRRWYMRIIRYNYAYNVICFSSSIIIVVFK